MKKGKSSYLVFAENPANLVSIEISKENQTIKPVKFNLLENLIYGDDNEAKIELVTLELERAFVEYCFESSKNPGKQKITKVETVFNRSV